MGYCFVRIEKIKNNASFTRKYEHNYRTENVPNAIPELRNQNEELVPLRSADGNTWDYLTAYQERIKSLDYYKNHKVTKTNVRGLEIFTTFSRESKDQVDIEKWKEENVRWIREYFNRCPEKYGDNVISVMYHGDECGNVHCHAIVIPIDEQGKLSADKYIGNRTKMRSLQDSYAKAMEPLGLERGLKGSSARHQDISKFYAKLNEKMEVPLPEKGESTEEYRLRMMEFIQTERADSLRKVMEMDRDLRRQRDISYQRNIASVDAELKNKQQQLENMEQIIRQKEKISREQELAIAEKKKEIIEINLRAKDRQKKMGTLEDIKSELDSSRRQRAAMDYARDEGYGTLVDEIEKNMEIVVDLYEKEINR